MKTDGMGRPPADPGYLSSDLDTKLHERLRRRFDVALASAERDYATLRLDESGAVTAVRRRAPGAGAAGRRLAAMVAAVGVVIVLVVAASAMLYRPVEMAGPAAASSESATIPPAIDGQKVYALPLRPDWPKDASPFLLRAYVAVANLPCPSRLQTPATTADAEFAADCGPISLVSRPVDNTSFYFNISPNSVGLLAPWAGGDEVVVRVHTHDPGASGCSEPFRSQCEGALVIEAVIWHGPARASDDPSPMRTVPLVVASAAPSQQIIPANGSAPTIINGERVYTIGERPQWGQLNGSFLLVGYRRVLPTADGCTSLGPRTEEEARALRDLTGNGGGGCNGAGFAAGIEPSSAAIDIAPKSPAFQSMPTGVQVDPQLLIVRAHTNDAEAASCPDAYRSKCAQAVVLDEIVWPANLASQPTATTPAKSN